MRRAVRSFLFPGEATKFNGQVAFRALIPANWSRRALGSCKWQCIPHPNATCCTILCGADRIMNLIGCGQSDLWEEEGWSIPATNEEFAKAYSDFAPDLVALIRNIPQGALFKWGLRDREPLKTWTVGRVTMLGDAAHPMTPFLGQGACMAIEDALLLGRAFAASETVREALRRYEAAARPAAPMFSFGLGRRDLHFRIQAERGGLPPIAVCSIMTPSRCPCDACYGKSHNQLLCVGCVFSPLPV